VDGPQNLRRGTKENLYTNGLVLPHSFLRTQQGVSWDVRSADNCLKAIQTNRSVRRFLHLPSLCSNKKFGAM
jgi:hypothetical protein